ncbi:50S ribosomal protein L25 [Geothrix limicola]|uniref:Large ribosomal subunit protein bL25 n=1 Tax=Geothrix limicola TaxID=2927978 RepID=A0ABQ5QIH5_9BACT|nr:50S ribosomal protein L25 [Geothrix limicola]GLH74356.1 50S ribosomal protein L25 [Geothrix limicola]
MSQEVLIVPKRDAFGKAAIRELKKSGMIPAVVYGLNEPPVAIAISPKAVARVLASDTGMNSVMFLQREGTDIKRHVIIKDLQRDPITSRLRHVDFMRVDMTLKVRVKVPVRLNGTSVGVKSQGGVLDFAHREIEVECLPSIIPSHIDVDITNLAVGDSVRFEQLSLAPNVVFTGDAHQVVCSVRGKAAEEEAAATPAAEPEVVKKGKKDEKK